MAVKHKLYFRARKGGLSAEKLKEELRARGLKVATVNLFKGGVTGVLAFQRKGDRDTVRAGGRLDIDGVRLQWTGCTPPGSTAPKKKTAEAGDIALPQASRKPGGVDQMTSKFFNPYHFVDVQGFTPRYEPVYHDRFSGHCGRIEAWLDFRTPVFIPDPENNKYIISDETLLRENEEEAGPERVHPTLSAWLNQKNLQADDGGVEIRFDPDCPGWDPEKAEKHIWAVGTGEQPAVSRQDSQQGVIRKDEKDHCYIETHEPSRWAHKVMHFFRIGDKYSLPATSLRGMLRSTVETLSNSCFIGAESADKADYMFHRLDVQSDNRELRGLKPVILKKSDDGKWGYVILEQAKVLSPHMLNRIGGSGESALCAYLNQEDSHNNYYEKISVRGKNGKTISDCSGIHAYDRRKKGRGAIDPISFPSEIVTSAFVVTKIKSDTLTHGENQYNKTFPFVGSTAAHGRLWAIIRRCNIPTRAGGHYPSYKIKEISDCIAPLKKKLANYQGSSDGRKREVCYDVSEIRIKTAFDIDTKTQHRAFFIFGGDNLDEAVESRRAKDFGAQDKKIIAQFRSLLRQRKEHAAKLQNHPQGINRALLQSLPDDIYEGMPAYYHENRKYLTYTTVPQKPYQQSPRDILAAMDKLPCDRLDRLCPACQLFGTVPANKNADRQRPAGYRGKVTVSCGWLENRPAEEPAPVTLKPLATPKPTFYPFYLTNNRRNGRERGRQPTVKNYDGQNLRIGRKTYLHHAPGQLHYISDRKTNRNATIHPLPAGRRFCFTIDFENLTNYELGLLLYSLDMKYEEEKVGFHLGMAKSLGLGSCRITRGNVTLYDLQRRYQSLENDGRTTLAADGVHRSKKAYQYVQGTGEKGVHVQRRKEVNAVDLLKGPLPAFLQDGEIRENYLSRPHIREFHVLKSVNLHSNMKLGLPVHFAGGMQTEGFKWYQKARENPAQRLLFDPAALATDVQNGDQVERHALEP